MHDSLPKSKDGGTTAAREKERSAIKMALFNSKGVEAYCAPDVIVHILDASFVFRGDGRVQLLAWKFNRPDVTRSEGTVLRPGEHSLTLSTSTNDGLKFSFATDYPSGGEFKQVETSDELPYDTWKLTSCSRARLKYGSLELIYDSDKTIVWIDKTNESCIVSPVKKTSRDGRISYEFYVTTSNVGATVGDAVSERSFQVYLPGAGHVIVEKAGAGVIRNGYAELPMQVVKEGKIIRKVDINTEFPTLEVVPYLLAKLLPTTLLELP